MTNPTDAPGVSYAESRAFTCPQCGQPFTADVWLIVAGEERPDLVERMRAGDLHAVRCPGCGPLGMIDAPLLLYRPGANPPLLFSPAQQTSAEQDRAMAHDLTSRLRDSLGDAWDESWLAQGIPGVQRAMLPAALSDDPQAVLTVIHNFIQADSWDASQRIVESHPELLSDEADDMLSQLVETARSQNDEARLHILDEHRDLLRRCREVGIARAFAEKMLPPEALAQASQMGLTPEEFLAQMRANRGGGGPPVPPEFADDLARAQEAEQRYQRAGDLTALDEAAAAWERILRHPSFPAADARFQLAAMNDAGGVALRRYWARGQMADLNRALELWQRAVTETPAGSPDLPSILTSLGAGLRTRFGRTGRLEDLEEAIRVYRQSVGETPAGSPDLPMYLNNLGNGLRDRFGRTGRLEDLEEAIRVYRQAVTETPAGSPDLPSILNNLGNGLRTRFGRTGRLEDLEEAIRVSRQAVRETPAGSPDLPSILNNLGNGLRTRFGRTGRLEDLEEAIRVFRQAVGETPAGSPDLPMYLNNLGNGLRDRFGRTGRLEDLEEAIRVYRQAVGETPAGSPALPGYLNNLGNGLRARFGRTGRLEDLEEAIRVYSQAVRETPAGSPDLPSILNNLGNGLRDRFGRTGRLEDLEEAIRVSRQAVGETPTGSPDLPMYLTNLGAGLSNRFGRTGRLEDLEEAIRVFRQAVGETPAGSPDLPMYLNNLGNGLSNRFGRTGRLEDLEEAIRVFRQAVAETPAGSPDLPGYLNNLGNGLSNRFGRTGRLEDLEEAIRVFRQAVAETPAGSPDLPGYLNNLGNGLRDRFGRTGRLEDLEEAINRYRAACIQGAERAPQQTLDASRNWGRWAVARRAWGEAAEAYGYGLATGRQMLARQLQRSQKENTLADLQEMAPAAAYAHAKLDKLEQAVTTIEGGRARLLAEALERNRRDLERLPERGQGDLYRRYQDITAEQTRLTQPVSSQPGQQDFLSGPARLDAILAANAAFDQVVAEIRQVPGYADFLAEPTFARIQAAAQPGVPLVYLLATAAGGLALVVWGGDEHRPDLPPATALWLDDLTEAKLREIVYGPADDPALGGYLGAYARWVSDPYNPDASAVWHTALDTTTAWLWDAVMAPVVEHLTRAGVDHAVLIPSGLLGLLPLHAAWTNPLAGGEGQDEEVRRYALDSVTFGYAPSSLALAASQRQAQSVAADGILAVDNPDGSLRFSGQEVDAALSHFDLSRGLRLDQNTALSEVVKLALPGRPVLHFSTHGRAGWVRPLQGALLLAGGGVLTLEEILELRLPGARLAVLSACETGVPGTKLPDEVVGLPAGLLQAGVAGVTASLWAVNDRSTALLMERFYQHWRGDGLSPADALCQAQRWLRDATRRQLGEYYASFIRRLPPQEAMSARAELVYRGDLDDRPYSHPYHWAAFTFSGA